MSRTKCVVIREELVALTGDYKKAIVLGQRTPRWIRGLQVLAVGVGLVD